MPELVEVAMSFWFMRPVESVCVDVMTFGNDVVIAESTHCVPAAGGERKVPSARARRTTTLAPVTELGVPTTTVPSEGGS